MRGIHVYFVLDTIGIKAEHRYSLTLGDGNHSQVFTLANPYSEYASDRWSPLLGESKRTVEWQTDSSAGIYVTLSRQYPNPNFEFTIKK